MELQPDFWVTSQWSSDFCLGQIMVQSLTCFRKVQQLGRTRHLCFGSHHRAKLCNKI